MKSSSYKKGISADWCLVFTASSPSICHLWEPPPPLQPPAPGRSCCPPGLSRRGRRTGGEAAVRHGSPRPPRWLTESWRKYFRILIFCMCLTYIWSVGRPAELLETDRGERRTQPHTASPPPWCCWRGTWPPGEAAGDGGGSGTISGQWGSPPGRHSETNNELAVSPPTPGRPSKLCNN